MKILVTGGAGFIGSHVVDAYIAAGHQVIVVDDLSTGRASNLNPEARFHQLDIRDPAVEELFAAERPEIVNHHAAQVDVRRSVAEPVFDAEVNIVGTVRLLEYAVRYGTRKFIYISSGGAVYGEPVHLPCEEDHPISPLCQYGASKHAVEHYLDLYWTNHGLDYTVLRYGNVYGPRQDPHGEAGVVAIFAGQMLHGRPVIINGSGEQTRDFVYVGDCARANLLALERGSGQIYNLGSGLGTSINQIFDRLKALTGYQREPIHDPPKLGETLHIYLDAARAADELGWTPAVNLDDGLRKTAAYFRQKEAALE